MRFKLKHIIFGKIAIILCLCLVLNNSFCFKSYAEESIAAQDPLFIPITSLVTAVALGSGIIGKNAVDSVNKLVDSVVSNIKSSEIQKAEADASYRSRYKVIDGDGNPEEPNDSNKNGKWVALGGGAIASGELWANKDTVIDIMSKINELGGYSQYQNYLTDIPINEIESSSSVSNVALQLAKISNSAVKQFDDFIHSTWFTNNNTSPDDYLYFVTVDTNDISNSLYPRMTITLINKANIGYLRVLSDNFAYSSHWYIKNTSGTFRPLNIDNIPISFTYNKISVKSHGVNGSFDYSVNSYSGTNNLNVCFYNTNGMGSNQSGERYAYSGYVNKTYTPWQFTQNVYNVNQTFDENFTNWLQGQIELIGQGVIDAVRLGLTTTKPSWNPTQEQIQTGQTPTSVIYQYINNYENPENIPDDEEEPDSPVVVPPAIEEPQPTNDYLGNFLLPESITTKFPFCIPFDIARALRLFSVSQREAPKWECDLNYGSSTYHVVIDLAMFNDVASFIRPLEFILFLVGLALGTRSLIRG